jgi:uncharacterized membrane protein YbhN (UPF0104 family)
VSKSHPQSPEDRSPLAGKKAKNLFLLLRISGAVAVLAILFQVADIEKVRTKLAQAEWTWILYATVITVLAPLLGSIRLKLFLAATGVVLSYRRCLQASLCGLSLNLLLPARGGDFAKVAFLRSGPQGPSWSTLAGAALLERGFDVLTLGLVGLTTALVLEATEAAIVSGIAATVAATGLLCLPRAGSLPLVGKRLSLIAQATSGAYRRKRTLLLAGITACFFWILVSAIMGCLFQAFDQNITLAHALAVTPPSIIVGIVPVSLWGVGTRDGALAYFLHGLTAPENAISAGFLYTALVYWLLGLIGLPALLCARRKTKTITDDSDKSNALGSS